MFPSLSSFFGQQGPSRVSPLRAEPDDPVSQAGPETSDRDSVEISDPARRSIQADMSSASFDTPGKRESIAVAEDGTYAPTVRTAQRLSVSFSFEFNLSIQRSVTAVTREPQAIHRGTPTSSSSARLSALESRSLYYQSILNESSGLVAGGYAESRSVQTELFYSRTRELSLSLPPSRAKQFDQTRARVTRSFQMNIRLDFSFLSQFTRQSGAISSLEDDLFGRYLDNTGGLSKHSSEALQSFFDDVDSLLDDSEAFVISSLSSFFDQVAENFGLSVEGAETLEKMMVDEVSAFFDEVDQFLSESRSAFTFLTEPVTAPEPPPPSLENTDEEDPAAILG